MKKLLQTTRPRFGLLARFALASFVAVALLGLVLAHTLAAGVRTRALADARRTAALIDGSVVRPELTAAGLENGLPQERVHALDRALWPSVAAGEVARIKVWNRDSSVVYATDHSIIGKHFDVGDDELEEALDGETVSDVDNLKKLENAGDRHFGSLLEVYTPVRFESGEPAGAFELYLPYRRSRPGSPTTRAGSISSSLPG